MMLQLTLTLSLLFTINSIQAYSENDIPEWNYLDTSVDPCDNFYDFTCGNFAKIHPRPPNQNIIDHFTLLEDEMIKIGHEILDSAIQDDDPVAVKKAKTAYKACINVQHDDSDFSPELRTAAEFGGMPLLSSSEESVEFSWDDIGDVVSNYGVPLIFVFNVVSTSQNETVIAVGADPMNNPSLFTPRLRKSYDEVLEESFQDVARRRVTRSTEPAAFDVFLRTLCRNLLKNTNPNKTDDELISDLDDMANFMRSLYAGGIREEGIVTLDTQTTVGDLQKWTQLQFAGSINIDWITYLNKVFRFSGVTITEETKFYHQGVDRIFGALKLVNQTDPRIVKNFALLRVFLFQAPDSNYGTRKAFEDYYTAKGYQLYDRWEYCTRKIIDIVDTATLSYAVTHAYERSLYNINKLAQAAEMVRNIQASFEEMLTKSEWLDAESKKLALEKAKNMLVLLGYPDFVPKEEDLDGFYENLRICSWDNYGNSRRIRAFKQAYQFTQLGQPDRAFWGKSTFDPNAYYNRPNNKIVLPISMLNPVFFYNDNPILAYSRLGSIIGHEITHGFDVNGKNYDQNGMPQNWWTDQTMEAFTERATCFKNQYSEYCVPEINRCINGSYSINENLADNGGIREAFNAFKKIIEKEGIKATGNYSLEQLFFIGYGTMWCSDESDYALTVLVESTNGYPPKKYRVLGSVSNMEEFSKAFSCPVGSNMNPKNKCVLW